VGDLGGLFVPPGAAAALLAGRRGDHWLLRRRRRSGLLVGKLDLQALPGRERRFFGGAPRNRGRGAARIEAHEGRRAGVLVGGGLRRFGNLIDAHERRRARVLVADGLRFDGGRFGDAPLAGIARARLDGILCGLV